MEIKYGLTHPIKSHSFLWQHFHFIGEVLIQAYHTRGFYSKLKLILSRPVSIHPESRNLLENLFQQKKSDGKINSCVSRYVIWQIIITVGCLFCFLLLEHYLDPIQQIIITLLVLITLINCGALLEQKRWIFYLEILRIAIIIFPMLVTGVPFSMILFVTILICLLLINFGEIRDYYFKALYK